MPPTKSEQLEARLNRYLNAAGLHWQQISDIRSYVSQLTEAKREEGRQETAAKVLSFTSSLIKESH